MTNLTITVDEETLKRARVRAIEAGTSVSAVLRAYLQEWARGPTEGPGETLLTIARRSAGGSGPSGRTWSRDDLHDR